MKEQKDLRRLSKFMSLVLRHQPQAIGLTVDTAGWARIDDLLSRMASTGRRMDRALLQHIVDTNDKKRFAISPDGTMIRASQGHSIGVSLGLEPLTPPDVLLHGTAQRFLSSILHRGLVKGTRDHVHLSESEDVARSVGQRHGAPVLLWVDTLQMHQDGHVFHRSDNGVWLTDHVPAKHIQVRT